MVYKENIVWNGIPRGGAKEEQCCYILSRTLEKIGERIELQTENFLKFQT